MNRALLLLLVWCPLAWGEPKTSKPESSGNGQYTVRLVEEVKNSCRLEVSRGDEPLWSLPRCLGGPDDRYFVSNDGSRVWVFRTTPEKPGPPRGNQKGIPWYKIEVATLYDAQGTVLRARRLVDLVPAKDWEKVRQLGKHFIWLQGVADVPGSPPHINDTGQVEFDVAGGKTAKLNF